MLVSAGHCKSLVFFIGGWRMTPEQMEFFSRSVPETNKVKYLLPEKMSELVRPWYCADLIYEYIKKHDLLDKDLSFVSFSLGGVVAQWLLSDHPELHVKQLILVGSPTGGYKFVPPNNYFSNKFPKELPIYVIAGNKSQNFWFLRNENDGVVDLDSALDVPDQNLKDAAIFPVEHPELKEIPEVQAQISRWLNLEQDLPQDFIAENKSQLTTSIGKQLFYSNSDNNPN